MMFYLHRFLTLWCVMLVVSMASMMPQKAEANFSNVTMDTPKIISNCQDIGYITARIVYCIRDVLIDAAISFNWQLGEFVAPAVFAFLTLMVVFFGIKVLTGEPRMKEQGFVFLFKMGLVLLLYKGLGGYIVDIYNIIEEGVELVTGTLNFSSHDECESKPYIVGAAGGGIALGSKVWAEMDCIFDLMFGTGKQVALGASLFGSMAAVLFSGALGVFIFFGILGILFSFVFMVIRSIYSLLMAYMYVTFGIIISPLIIPLMLGGQKPQAMFEGWLNGMIAASIIPIFLFAYLALAFPLVADLIYDDGSGDDFGSIAGIRDHIEEKHGPRQNAGSCPVVNDSEASAMLNGGDPNSPANASMVNSFLNGSFDLCSMFGTYDLELSEEDMAEMRELFMQLIKIMVLIWLLSGMMDTVIDIGSQTLRGAISFISQIVGQQTIVEQTIQGGLQGAQHGSGQFLGAQGYLQQERTGLLSSGRTGVMHFGTALSEGLKGGLAGASRGFQRGL